MGGSLCPKAKAVMEFGCVSSFFAIKCCESLQKFLDHLLKKVRYAKGRNLKDLKAVLKKQSLKEHKWDVFVKSELTGLYQTIQATSIDDFRHCEIEYSHYSH